MIALEVMEFGKPNDILESFFEFHLACETSLLSKVVL